MSEFTWSRASIKASLVHSPQLLHLALCVEGPALLPELAALRAPLTVVLPPASHLASLTTAAKALVLYFLKLVCGHFIGLYLQSSQSWQQDCSD